MRFVFKTSYDADIQLFKHRAQAVWYGLLVAFGAGDAALFRSHRGCVSAG